MLRRLKSHDSAYFWLGCKRELDSQRNTQNGTPIYKEIISVPNPKAPTNFQVRTNPTHWNLNATKHRKRERERQTEPKCFHSRDSLICCASGASLFRAPIVGTAREREKALEQHTAVAAANELLWKHWRNNSAFCCYGVRLRTVLLTAVGVSKDLVWFRRRKTGLGRQAQVLCRFLVQFHMGKIRKQRSFSHFFSWLFLGSLSLSHSLSHSVSISPFSWMTHPLVSGFLYLCLRILELWWQDADEKMSDASKRRAQNTCSHRWSAPHLPLLDTNRVYRGFMS